VTLAGRFIARSFPILIFSRGVLRWIVTIVVYVILLPIIGSLLAKNGDRIAKALAVEKVQQEQQKSP